METVTTSQMPQIKFQWWWAVLGAVVLFLVIAVSGYNGLVGERNNVVNARANVQTQYQRRSDLIPNLVSTVQGSANFEKSTLVDVVDARAKATAVKIDTANTSPEDLQKFFAAQNNLGSSLSRLLVTVEAYPDLKSSQNFRDLQVQLEGTENRISTSRMDYNKAVTTYNNKIQTFPNVLTAGLFGFKSESVFQASEGAQSAPNVQFNFSGSSSSMSK